MKITRRQIQTQLLSGSGLALAAGSPGRSDTPLPRGKAQACILLWLGGGMCHVDTFDPKRLGDPKTNKPGSAYPSIDTAIPNVRVCEHLSRTARVLDRGALIRTVNHPLKVDHADSTNLVKTGRTTSGTVIYPSLGSLVTHQLGPRSDGIPPYIVMGLPNVTRGPGFLGGKYGYLYLTDSQAGPIGLRRPWDVTHTRQRRRHELLGVLRDSGRRAAPDNKSLGDYDRAIGEAQRLMNGGFPKVFDLAGEPAARRQQFGGEFGQRCLLARRLIDAGVRFVEVAYNLNFKNGTGWDTHRHGQANQHLLIQDLDQSLSSLVMDLEIRNRLDQTLIVVATEFGRPPEFDGQGGRGHQSAAFSVALFGGGLRTGLAIGVTDELGRKPIQRPVTVPDLHATILSALGVDPAQELYDGARPIPITDHGNALTELFS